MKSRTVKAVVALSLSLQLGIGMAAAPIIGTIFAGGPFRLDRMNVTGNTTVFEGSLLETTAAPSTILLSSGARLSLEAGSRGKVFGDRLILEKGGTRLDNGTGFHLEALGLRVQPELRSSTGRVALDGPRVRVAALTGSFRILNAQGQLVANLRAGSTLAFEPRPGGSTETRVTGLLEKRDGHYLMTDEVTNVRVEAVGRNMSTNTGKRVEIAGLMDAAATPATGASQTVRVMSLRQLPTDPTTAAPAGQGGAGTGAGAGTGIGVATVAIVAGVVAAAVVGGLAVANKLPGQDEVSR